MASQPRIPHQVNAITLTVETLSNGAYRLSSPQARGWAALAQSPLQLARVLHAAFQEVQVASYARQRGAAYDLDALTSQQVGDPLADTPQTRRRPRVRRLGSNVPYDPADWRMVDTAQGFKWRSPSGREYKPDSTMAASIVAKRRKLGLPVDTP